jgi:hypothetical protein
MQKILSVLIMQMLFSATFAQNPDDYMTFSIPINKAYLFQSGEDTFRDYFKNAGKKIGGRDYAVKVREYSSGPDTSYYRMDETNFYHYDVKRGAESVVLPRRPKVGQTWLESDKSWKYTILKTGQSFTSGDTTFSDCILMECKQMSGRDKNKDEIYYLYYAKGFGYAGSVDKEGKVLSFFKHRMNAGPQFFSEIFENCDTHTFQVEGEIRARSDRFSVIQAVVGNIPRDTLKSLKGKIMVQILVDSLGNVCVLSLANSTGVPHQILNLVEALEKKTKWNLPPAKESEAPARDRNISSCSVLVFTFSEKEVLYQRLSSNPFEERHKQLERATLAKSGW